MHITNSRVLRILISKACVKRANLKKYNVTRPHAEAHYSHYRILIRFKTTILGFQQYMNIYVIIFDSKAQTNSRI